ncbi:RNA polymerase III transcription factor IIIC subunit-domain-containing protein [Coniochaeta sp. 2T2.1]|nr:RNA polymerase III transcription factor IIIC subunit-domain-containing protein [Coniochaeta sp. 2T2.1]
MPSLAQPPGAATAPSKETGAKNLPQAPSYSIPPRRFGAVEHPMIIKDIDKGIKTFGRGHSFQTILDSASPQISVPLYFRPDNPTVRPLTSHNAASHNVIVKVTIPKRTGRKRKRGTDAPFEYYDAPPAKKASVEEPLINPTDRRPPPVIPPGAENILSHSHLDTPSLLRRKLRDTAGRYTLEPVGVVHNTHRYRGLSDFQYSLGNSKFMNRFVAQVMPGSIPKLRQYEIEVGTAQAPDIDLVPPPFFAPQGMPNSYNYTQNPFVRNLGVDGLGEEARPVSGGSDDESESDVSSRFSEEFESVVNTSMRGPAPGYFIRYNEFPSPARPRVPPDLSDPHVAAVMAELRRAMNERPVWTRRSMFNRLSSAVSSLPKSGNIIKHCIQYAGYQFRGGPWRDSLVKYGVDPRSDPKYRVYQTLIFKLHKRRVGNVGGTWQSVRRKEVSTLSGSFGRYWKDSVEAADSAADGERGGGGGDKDSNRETPSRHPSRVGHEFDGTSFSTDGKVWQVCDISDPLLARLFAEAQPLPECDFEKSGWYPPVLWFVAKAIMKRKMLAIRFKRHLPDAAFEPALKIVRDAAAAGKAAVVENINVPLPDLGLTTEEREQIRGRKMKGGRKGRDRSDKNKNATLRIRQKMAGGKAEVRFVEYPEDGRYQVVGRAMEDAPNSSSREQSAVVDGGEAVGEVEGPKESVADVVEKEETLKDLIESDEDDEDDEDDDDDDDDEESEGDGDELEEDEDVDQEMDDYDLQGEEIDEEAIQWRI